MEHRIAHACGHEQIHFLSGFAGQQERKARWLGTTSCRVCFAAARQAERAVIADRDDAAVAHLHLPALVGTDRQIAWAMTIRAKQLATMLADEALTSEPAYPACLAVNDAKWWIDHRGIEANDLLRHVAIVGSVAH